MAETFLLKLERRWEDYLCIGDRFPSIIISFYINELELVIDNMMRMLDVGQQINDFRVDTFLKSMYGYEQTYLATSVREEHNKVLLKLYDVAEIPSKQLSREGTLIEGDIRDEMYNDCFIPIHLYDTVSLNGKEYHCLIREYIESKRLSDLLVEGKRYSWDEAIPIIHRVLDGLSCLHRQERAIIHNDVTPRNILLCENEECETKVRIIGTGHLSYRRCGVASFPTDDLNPWYRAPETYMGMYNEQSDQFSAGALLYEMLTGKAPWQTDFPNPPYDAKLCKKMVKKAREAELLFPEELILTDNQQHILRKVLALDYEKRFSDIETFKKGLIDEVSIVNKTSPVSIEQENVSPWDEKIKRQTGNGFADVAGMEEVKQIFYKDVLFLLKNKEKVEKYKLKIPNGALLYGPPGCGKTYIAEKFAQESGLNFMIVKASDLGSIYIHGTQGKIAELFSEAEKKAPAVICFDEFDAMVPDRSRMDNVGQSGEVNEFLSQLNNCAERGIFVIGTSNRPDRIDPAVLRTGRIDKLIYVPLPDKEARASLFAFQLKDRCCKDGIDCEILADKTEGYVASDITFIVNETALAAAMKDIPISQELLMDEIGKIRKSVTKEQRSFYESMYAGLQFGRLEERRRIGFATYK